MDKNNEDNTKNSTYLLSFSDFRSYQAIPIHSDNLLPKGSGRKLPSHSLLNVPYLVSPPHGPRYKYASSVVTFLIATRLI